MKYINLVLLALFINSCASIQKHNAQINQSISPKKLQKDVDFIHKKLNKYHPDLYHYISKTTLDHKFDSLKLSLNKPMTGFEFYLQLTPILNSIKQGHIAAIPIQKKLTKKQTKSEKKKGQNPLLNIDFEEFNNKIYIVENHAKSSNLQLGDELIAINHRKTEELLPIVRKLYSSDGYNQTLFNRFSAKLLPVYFTYQYGIQDSIQFDIKRNDTLKSVWVFRKDKSVKENLTSSKKLTKHQKDSIKAQNDKQYELGYNPKTKKYNRNFNYLDADSCIAIMKIRAFSNGNYKKFYKNSFLSLQKNHAHTLVIDLRDNGGGRLSEITDLYGYLTPDSTYTMVEKQFMTRKTSMFQIRYFSEGNALNKTLRAVVSPFFYTYMFLKTKKESENYYFSTKFRKPQLQKNEAFKGNVYLMINGNSFSASSILSAQLKANQRATIVGEETGGAFNSTVAGTMPLYTLPYSKTRVRFGLQWIAPTVQSQTDGRGVLPDIEIVPNLQDRLEKKDTELQWILRQIEQQKVTQ